MFEKIVTILSIALIGAVVAIGKLLISKEKISFRVMAGKGIIGAALGLISYPAVAAFTYFIPIPGALELQIIIGFCCFLSVLGVEFMEKMGQGILDRIKGK